MLVADGRAQQPNVSSCQQLSFPVHPTLSRQAVAIGAHIVVKSARRATARHGQEEEMATAKKVAKRAAKKAPAKKGAKKLAPAKKAPAKRAPAKKAPAKKRTPNSAFMKAMTPSAALAAVIGDKPMPRTEVTKKVWDYIKRNGLQDVAKRTMINADVKLKALLGGDKGHGNNPGPSISFSMFELTKIVNRNLK